MAKNKKKQTIHRIVHKKQIQSLFCATELCFQEESRGLNGPNLEQTSDAKISARYDVLHILLKKCLQSYLCTFKYSFITYSSSMDGSVFALVNVCCPALFV